MSLSCQSCGNVTERGATLTVEFRNGETTCLCDLCNGLIDAGLLRAEMVDGEVRYRTWSLEWHPGDLLPSPLSGKPAAPPANPSNKSP